MKKWLQISINTDPILVETLSDYLVGIHGAGVELAAEEEKSTGKMSCFIEQILSEKEAQDIVSQITVFTNEMASIFNIENPTISWEFIEDEDWSKTWKEHFHPFSIVPGLTISPIWEKYQVSDGELVIEMDPGMAFGTGHHETTSLSLELLQDIVKSKNSKTVLDIGCGTGILAMGAVLFGAGKTLGIDNCPDAVRVATENIAHNKLSKQIEIAITPVEQLSGSYDIVVANIIHDVLADLSASITKRTVAGGYLILSGVLAGEQAKSITAIFENLGFSLVNEKSKGEWAAVLLKNN
ncbi:MAG: 50S ribosomal protein L11 methyltransferase [Desulfotalea sp.]